mmetsp:Transcript_93050/g.272319  ORF Transcript_93050/g.272319 Transcript_93050/m.272319 type:complete len:213 (-) Transcript_93050:119-757(-)
MVKVQPVEELVQERVSVDVHLPYVRGPREHLERGGKPEEGLAAVHVFDRVQHQHSLLAVGLCQLVIGEGHVGRSCTALADNKGDVNAAIILGWAPVAGACLLQPCLPHHLSVLMVLCHSHDAKNQPNAGGERLPQVHLHIVPPRPQIPELANGGYSALLEHRHFWLPELARWRLRVVPPRPQVLELVVGGYIALFRHLHFWLQGPFRCGIVR